MSTILKLPTVLLTTGSVISVAVPWEGGSGLLNVVGTFVGATSFLNMQAFTDDTGSLFTTLSGLSGVPANLAVAGSYPFEAPKGGLVITVQAVDPGDSINLTELSILDMNPHV